MRESGYPTTPTCPLTNSRSSLPASSMPEATSNIIPFNSSAAMPAARPTICVVRLPWEPPSYAATSVSGMVTTISSAGRPKCSATICVMPMDTAPDPLSVAAVTTVTVPSSFRINCTDPGIELVIQVPAQMPMPCQGFLLSFSCDQGAASSIFSNPFRNKSASSSTCPLNRVSPFPTRFRSRYSRRSTPSSSAI